MNFDVGCECQEKLFNVGYDGLPEGRNGGSLPDEMVDSCVWNEEVSAEQGFKVRVQFLEADRLGEP